MLAAILDGFRHAPAGGSFGIKPSVREFSLEQLNSFALLTNNLFFICVAQP
jgi:hypothetical protein